MHELKTIELNHRDDNVKIQIRENRIHAPQYLINKIKQLIQSMIYQTKILTFQSIQNAFVFKDKDYSSLKSIARNYNCELEQIKTEIKRELIILPKGIKNASASKYIIKESKQFYSSLSIPRILSISNHTIEIHQSYDLTVSFSIEFFFPFIRLLFFRLILQLYRQSRMLIENNSILTMAMVILNLMMKKKFY